MSTFTAALGTGGSAPSGADVFRRPHLDARAAAAYESLARGEHADGPAGRIAFCVYTDNPSEGRGDIYVACGLARSLVRRGWGVRFIPRTRWSKRIDDVDVVVALLPSFDPAVVADGIPAVAWTRNETTAWMQRANLSLYDMVLSSSTLARDALREVYDGPTGLLAIGVDTELFRDEGHPRGATAVTSVNHWGRDRALHEAMRDAPADADIVWYGDPERIPSELNRWSVGLVSYFALPAAYQRALLVLDDLNHTTLPFGSVNSRVFEAVACGALPVTNGGLGLAELGLGEIPVYHTGEDLQEILRARRKDIAGTRALVSRLQKIVTLDHSFERRADEFMEMLPAARERAASVKPTVAFSPDYRSTNPYQDMLYAGAVSSGVRVVPAPDPARSPFPRDPGGPLEQRALHIHWTAPLLQNAKGPNQALQNLRAVKRSVQELRERGGRLLWTVHNVLPHECRWRAAEIELCRFLAASADAIHVMGEETAETVRPLYELPPDRTFVVPHSSYTGVYPDFVGRAEARRRLGLRQGEIALLVLGGLRAYKGMSRLFRVFDRAAAADARLRLLVAGKPGTDPATAQWKNHCEQHPRIVSQFSYVAEFDLQVWLRAADVALLPYESILNSGALQLTLTFGVPVVAPRLGTIGSTLSDEFAEGFDASDEEDLLRAVETAVERLRTQAASAAARRAAEKYPPSAMGADFAAHLRKVLDG